MALIYHRFQGGTREQVRDDEIKDMFIDKPVRFSLCTALIGISLAAVLHIGGSLLWTMVQVVE